MDSAPLATTVLSRPCDERARPCLWAVLWFRDPATISKVTAGSRRMRGSWHPIHADPTWADLSALDGVRFPARNSPEPDRKRPGYGPSRPESDIVSRRWRHGQKIPPPGPGDGISRDGCRECCSTFP